MALERVMKGRSNQRDERQENEEREMEMSNRAKTCFR